MSPAGLEPTIPASERPQTHALDRAASGIGHPAYSLELLLSMQNLGTKFSVVIKVLIPLF
jgi:hypothetical protein